MKESRKRLVLLRLLCPILTIILHGHNQKQSRGKNFQHNLVHGIVDHGEKHTVGQALASMAHTSVTQ